MNLSRAFFYTAVVLLLSQANIHEVNGQSPETSVDFISVISSSDSTPFWIQSNRYGIFSPSGNQVLTRIQSHDQTELFDNSKLTLTYGADLIARPGAHRTLSFNQAYVKLNMYGVELAGGRFHSQTPIHDERLSMGSLGVSGNATPVPQVRLGLQEWTPLPFTREFVQIRVHAAHGWLRGERFTQNVLYHEKVGHARFGGDFPLNVYGGLAHYAKWGGKNNPNFGDLPSKFSDFWRVFLAVGGDEEAPDVEANYMLGDHLGTWDFGFFLEFDSYSINGYRQHPLETKDNLKLKSLQDALNGISVRLHDAPGFPIKGFLYEFLYTKWQDGPRVDNIVGGVPCRELPEGTCRDDFRGNENYYNHHIYRTGWATFGRTIGNPLFRVSDTPTAQLNDGIDNNRIIAHHIGVDARLGRTAVVGKITASRNFGTRNDPFPEPLDQLSVGLQSQTPVSLFDQPFTLLADVAWDGGNLFGSQFGLALGIRWIH